MSKNYITKGSLSVSEELSDFLSSEVLPGLEISEGQFWSSLEIIINEFSPRNKELLNTREYIQEQIDTWHKSNPGKKKILMFIRVF